MPLVGGDSLRQALSFDASGLPTGSLPVRYEANANYPCSRMGTSVAAEVLVDNRGASPFGNGWSLAELSSLTVGPDGVVVVSEGDGTTLAFEPESPDVFLDPVGFPANVAGAGVAADFDGDGDLDVAFPEGGTGKIVTLLGDGAGGFPGRLEVVAGTVPSGAAPDVHTLVGGDFNGDTIPDLVVNNQLSGFVKVFLGLGGGLLAPPVALPVPAPQSLGVADFNLDGHDDIAVGTSFGASFHQLSVFFGDGTGAFPTSTSLNVSRNLLDMEIADFDNSGTPDIAVASATFNEIAVLLGDGLGGFTAATFPTGSIRSNIARNVLAAADYDGDGNADLAVVNQFGDTIFGNTLKVFFGDGTGAFPVFTTVPSGIGEANTITSADFNDDGIPDIAVGARASPVLSIKLGDGARGFSAFTNFPVETGGGISPLLSADFNADGAADLFLGISAQMKVHAILADPTAATVFRSPGADFSVLAANADGSFTRRLKDGTVVEFNAAGRQTAFIDRNGNTTSYAYDPASGRLASITDPAGIATSFAYQAGGLASITDSAARASFFTIDAAGNLVAATNPDGSVKRFTYDANNRLIEEASERGFVTTQSYGFAGQFTGSGFPDGASITASISKSLGLADLGIGIGSEANPAPYSVPNGTAELMDAKGNPFTMRFNEFSSVIEVTDPIGRTTTLTRDTNDLVTQTVAPSDGELPNGTVPGQVVTELDYDAQGNVTAQREAAGTTLERQTLFEYEPVFNRATKITDPSNTDPAPACGTAGVTCFTYDTKGNLEKTTAFVDGQAFDSQVSTFDPTTGLELSRQDANGNLTDLAYDLFGNPQTITDAELNETQFVRDTAGRMAGRTEGFGTPEQRTTSFTYDAMNRVETETDGTGAVATTRYDPAGNKVETEDATGIVVVRAYDERDRLTLEDDPAQGPVTRTYDVIGNLETLATALPGQTVTLVYDTVNRVEKTTDPLGGDRLFGYDAQDNLVSVTDARQAALPGGVPTTFVFDPLGRRIRRANQLGETWAFEFDSRDNMTRAVDAKGQVLDRAYDDLARLTTVTLIESDGTTVEDTITFTYAANGNRLTAKDGDSSLTFAYDALNRIETAATVADAGSVQPPVVLTSVYDAVGNRTQLSHGPNELVIDGAWNYTHDAVGRLIDLISPTGDPLNPISLGYDPAGRLARIDFPNQVVSDVQYDLDGRPSRIDHTRGLAELTSFTYGYDAEGKITSIAEPVGTRNFTYDAFQQLVSGGFPAVPESYAYDEEGNRLASHLSAAHTHDDANRLLADATFTYAYDANGNLETKTETATSASTSYAWDVQNRLVRIDFPDLTSASYRFDADGRRIEKDVNGAVTRYLYDDADIVLEYDGTNALQARYSHGLEVDQPLAQERGGQNFFYHIDHLGSIRKLTDAAGMVTNSYGYDSYGRIENIVEGVSNPFTFTAREFDTESGLYFYRARYYDPIAGRFLSEDPIGFEGQDLNVYRYVFNDPTSFTDPKGQLFEFGALVKTAKKRIAAALIAGSIAKFVVKESFKPLLLAVGVGARNVADPVIQLVAGFLEVAFNVPIPTSPTTKAGEFARVIGSAIGALFGQGPPPI